MLFHAGNACYVQARHDGLAAPSKLYSVKAATISAEAAFPTVKASSPSTTTILCFGVGIED